MKYYVRFGKLNKLVVTGNPYAACVQTIREYMKDKRKTLPTFFSVSQRGFEEHDDDEVIATSFILRVIQMSTQAKATLRKRAKKEAESKINDSYDDSYNDSLES